MAVARKKSEFDPVTEFDDWYKDPRVTDPRTGALGHFALAECANNMWKKFEDYKREHLGRTQNYEKYETMADAEVVSQKPDLPNVSSGDIATVHWSWELVPVPEPSSAALAGMGLLTLQRARRRRR